ncbi:MAG: N-acetylglucosamine/diacetylchitobiose ABC transporter substrate-binding protein [Kribbellaceae bacterium]
MQGDLRRRTLLTAAALVPASGLLASCDGDDRPAGGRTTPVAPRSLDVNPDASLEIVVPEGGYGQEHLRFDLDMYRELYPGARERGKVTAVPEIATALQPRFDAGDPPDVLANSGAKRLNASRLENAGQLADLTPLLDAQSWDQPDRTVREMLIPGTVESGSYDGVPRVLNYVNTVYALWYSAPLFDKYGWSAPRTWDELLRTAAEMKAKNLAPFIYAGLRPQYLFEAIMTLAAKSGGLDVVKHVDNLEDGAWKDPSLAAAAAAFSGLAGRGYVFTGSRGLDPLQSQTRFVGSKAGLLPCGSWLANEMRNATPKGFGLTAMALPPLDGSARLPNGVHVTPSESFVVPAAAKNRIGGMEFLRAMLSVKAAANFSELTSTLTVVRSAGDLLVADAAFKSACELLRIAGDQTINWYFASWYPALGTATAEATGALMAGAITVAEWAERLQKAADDVKKDSSVTKFRRG